MKIEHVTEIENLCDEMVVLYKSLDNEKKFDRIKSLTEKACKNIPDSTGITFSFQLNFDKPQEDKHIPYYEMGSISIQKPLCTQCGYEINPQYFSLG